MKLFNSKLNKKLQEFVDDFNEAFGRDRKNIYEVILKINAIAEYLGIDFYQKTVPKEETSSYDYFYGRITKDILVAKKKEDDKKEEIFGTINGVQITQSDIDVLIKCKLPIQYNYDNLEKGTSNKKTNKKGK